MGLLRLPEDWIPELKKRVAEIEGYDIDALLDRLAAMGIGQLQTMPQEMTRVQGRWLGSNPLAADVQRSAPDRIVAFAAAELRRYLGEILGVTLPEAASTTERPVIHLDVDPNAGLTDEGYQMRADGRTFQITGGGPAGVVFGSYEFLRRYGGCRFADLGPDGEYVPRKQRIEAPAAPLRMKPKLWYRGLQFYFYEDNWCNRQDRL